MNKKSLLITSVVGIVAFVALAITFFFTDLNISIALASKNLENPNFFLKAMAAVGEFPIYIGPLMFGLVYGMTNKTKLWKLIAHFVGFVITYVAGYRLLGGIFEEFYGSELAFFHISLLAIAALLIYILLFMLFSNFKEENLLKIRDISLVMMLVSACAFASVTCVKYVMGRVRFRALDTNYSEFTNFLTIRDFLGGLEGDDFRSFPSGHTCSATCAITLVLIPMRLSNKKWMTYLVLGLTSLYALIMAVSRIAIGAHYASDVLFAFACTIIWFILIHFVFYKKGWLNARGN